MEYWSLGISITALLLSGFTFYWTSVRHVRNLYYIGHDRLGSTDIAPEFTIINASNKDIVLLNIDYSVGCPGTDKRVSHPGQRIDCHEGDFFLLPPGTGRRYIITTATPITEDSIKEGNPFDFSGQVLYEHRVYVNVHWVEMDGKEYKKSIKYSDVKLDINAHPTMSKTETDKVDLHKLR